MTQTAEDRRTGLSAQASALCAEIDADPGAPLVVDIIGPGGCGKTPIIEAAARHYALIAELIQHYLAVMPFRYKAVRYEDLVTNQEREVRELLDFIGEPFDARMLNFHDNQRPARTASYAQVTEKLYDRSRYRYRNYLRQLEPVIPILEPAIARLGYTI